MTNPYDLNPAVAAARAILISQSRHRNTKEKPLTIREAAKRYKASKSAIGRHLTSMKLFGKPAFSDNSVGRPRNLDEAEERAVIEYIMWLERAGFPCNQLLIEEAANSLRASRTEKQRIWRLLVIDGFTGKTSLEFMEYCIRFDIEIIILPPHSTHLTQPLDVGVFQLLKNAHQKLLRRHIREGYLNFKRSGFISKLSEILREGFTVHNIMNGFEKSGIFPVDGRGVIHKVKEKKKSLLATTNPALQSLLPKETRFKDAREVSRHLKRNYRDGFSSPTRHSFGILDDVVCEAVLLNSFAEEHIQTRLQRIAATNNKRNKRKKVMPSGKYINSVTVEQAFYPYSILHTAPYGIWNMECNPYGT
jgi:hypothetical protein